MDKEGKKNKSKIDKNKLFVKIMALVLAGIMVIGVAAGFIVQLLYKR